MDFLKKMTFANWFCVWVFLACFAFLWWLCYMAFNHTTTPNDISEIKMSVIGTMGAVVGFVVGSSASSKAKDEIIRDKAKPE